jgi:hypothetical protein
MEIVKVMDMNMNINMDRENGLDPNVLDKRTIRVLIVGPANEKNYHTI